MEARDSEEARREESRILGKLVFEKLKKAKEEAMMSDVKLLDEVSKSIQLMMRLNKVAAQKTILVRHSTTYMGNLVRVWNPAPAKIHSS